MHTPWTMKRQKKLCYIYAIVLFSTRMIENCDFSKYCFINNSVFLHIVLNIILLLKL